MERILISIGLVISLLFISCEKNDDNTETVSLEATNLELVSGDNQSGDAESTLEQLIVVLVKDQNGNVFQGTTVNFSVSEGNVSQQTATSDENGEASVEWTLGSTEGEQILTITAFKSDGITQINGSPCIVKANATELMPNSITYTGENSGTYKISGTAIDDNGNPLSGIKIECHLFEDGGDYASIVGPLYVKTKTDGKYSFQGLPNPDQYEELNISMYTFTLYSTDALNDQKYERSNCWPAVAFGGTFPATEINKDILLLEVNTSTILKGTIKYSNGNPVPVNELSLIDVSYGQHDEYQAYALDFGGGVSSDESTGSFYDEATGEFQLKNCLKGGNHNYALHVNHIDLETYSSWDSHITINEGVENEITVTIVEN